MRHIGVLYRFNRTFLGSLKLKTTHGSASSIRDLRRHSILCQAQSSRSYSRVESQPPRTFSSKSVKISGDLPISTYSLIPNATNIDNIRPGGGWGFFRFFSGNSAAEAEVGGRIPIERGVVSPPRTVPDHIPKTPYYATGIVLPTDSSIYLHTPESLAPMREACTLARDMLDLCCEMAQPGVTTDEIDAAVHSAIVEAGACPSPLNYHGFPKSVCSSVNEVACHAIPDDRPLQDGDIVSFDVSVFLKGFHGDNCATVGVGKVDDAARRLMNATKEGMMAGVSVCRPGACMTEIGSAIHAVADLYGYETVQKYCGHGVGSSFHMMPFVEHFRNNRKLEMVAGMTFTIEPIFTEGSQATITWSDGWTVQTIDGSRAAQFEHVVLITQEGHEILTIPSQPP